MSEHAAFGREAEALTAYERSRLRPGVDEAALERLLALLAAAGHGAAMHTATIVRAAVP